jgi:hypothetical protein
MYDVLGYLFDIGAKWIMVILIHFYKPYTLMWKYNLKELYNLFILKP